jgi:acid phosphatase type 7
MPKYLWLLLLLALSSPIKADVLIYGDTRSQPEVHRALIQRVEKTPLQPVFHTGDQVQKGKKQAEYDLFKEIISPLKADFYPVRGNHERDLQLFLENYPATNGNSYYTVCHDSLKYIILDSNISLLPRTEQYMWLQQELESATLPVLLLLHHPVFSSGYHGQELGLELYLPALLKKHHVLAVISGHEHNFEHLYADGLHYLVTGGGGAPLREQSFASPYSRFFSKIHHYVLMRRTPAELQFQTYDLKGSLIYEFQVPLTGAVNE